jgi:hypothetical protein
MFSMSVPAEPDLEMAQLERPWAVVSAHRDGCSVHDIASHVGLSATRVHQLLAEFEDAPTESSATDDRDPRLGRRRRFGEPPIAPLDRVGEL